ncbi:hypothetical protein CN140_01615 [Sinorhizobium meliloti]|uniref:hypothetical protein n=1 Tax=Rhizobium meliloti TaxID=382 RepID=UPI000FE129A5|nr:hypothetical protein [Sinorhizobium meliloti]RVL87655.1 hypothetical protein CN140_01615 [Sinorhizobium meliloti]
MTTIADYQEWSKTLGCKEQDFADKAAFEGCIADRKAQFAAEAAQAQATADHQQMINYVGIGAAIAVVVVIVLLRRPIWRLIEGLFISSVAKTITTKRDLSAYRDDVARRIREKAESK